MTTRPQIDLLAGGANRGGNLLAAEFARRSHVLPLGHVQVADTDPERAEALARRYATFARSAVSLPGRVQDAEFLVEDEGPAILAIDDVGAMAGAMRRAHPVRPVLAQAVGRGATTREQPLPQVFGFRVLGGPGRPDESVLATRMLEALASQAPPQRSRVIRRVALAEVHLDAARSTVSASTVEATRTVRRLLDDEDELGSLVLGRQLYPMVLAERGGDIRTIVEEGAELTLGRRGAVGFLAAGSLRIDFLVFEAGGHLRAHLPFVPPPAPRNPSRPITRPEGAIGDAVGTAAVLLAAALTD